MEKAVNPTRIATKWAIVNALAFIVLTYAIKTLKVDVASPLNMVNYVPFIGCLVLTQVGYKNALGGYLPFREGFSAGFRYAVFTGLLIAIFTYFYLAFINPEIMEKSLLASRAQMVNTGKTSAQLDKMVADGRRYGPALQGFQGAINYAILGGIISLVGASLLKKDKPA